MKLSPHFVQRTKDWWKPKAGNILAILYISAYHFQLKADIFLVSLLPSILTIFGIGLTAYWINDWVDLPTDRVLNKKNFLINLTHKQQILFLIFALICSILPWLFLPKTEVTIYLLTLEFVLITTYSLRPLRLKTKGLIGVIADALYAQALPTVLAFYTFSLLKIDTFDKFPITFLLLFLWQFFAGLYNICLHQFEDLPNDKKSLTKTWALQMGKSKIRRLMLSIFLPLMILCYLAFLFLLNGLGWLIGLLSGIYILAQFVNVFRQKKPRFFYTTPFPEDLQRVNLHYHKFLPLIILSILVWNDQEYFLLLAIHLILFSFGSTSTFWHLSKKILHTYLIRPLYYYWNNFQKARYSEEKNGFVEKIVLKNSTFNVAFINRNKDKYTETFVRLRLETLKNAGYNVHLLFGNDLPTESEQKGTLLSNYATIRYFRKWYFSFMDKSQRELSELVFRRYLLNNNIQLVLAEFGTTGAEIAPICTSLNIPYVITFYGYDFHHKDTFQANKKKYVYALNNAIGVIGVSKEICDLLKPNMMHPEKVRYLPCLINTELFLSIKRDNSDIRFLSIGRFAETKAPHLTILAFTEVLKVLPNARLTMIGKDGGGELFEACIILAKALNVYNSIEFKGICSPEEIARTMKATTIFVQHSLTTPLNGDKEGTPVAIMEAMAAGIPIVATRHAGIKELITHEKNGLLVDEFDWKTMAMEMIRLANDSVLASQLSKNAKNRILTDELIVNGADYFLNYIDEIRTTTLNNES